jgi:hypothetical protein
MPAYLGIYSMESVEHPIKPFFKMNIATLIGKTQIDSTAKGNCEQRQ